MRLFSSPDDTPNQRAGRMLAAIVLAGLFATPFVGDIALKLAFLVGASVMTYWMLIESIREIRSELPRRQRSWAMVLGTIVQYAFYLSILAAFLVGVSKSIVK